MSKKRESQTRKEAWLRLAILFVSGIVLKFWGIFIFAMLIVNWIYSLFSGKKIKEICQLSETWNTQIYSYLRYITMVSDKRPFPFNNLEKNMSKVE